jgi:hypothetical protein
MGTGKININDATVQQLTQLAWYREKHGVSDCQSS